MQQAPTARQALQKPPGYRDPASTRPPAPRPPPPRRPQLPQTLRKKPSRRRQRSCCRRICCWICFIISALIFLLAVVGALSYLWFQPRLPIYRFVSIQSPHLRVAAGPDGALLYAASVIRIEVANPNAKIAISYGVAEARVAVADEDGDLDVGSGTVAGFVQRRRNSTVVRFVVGATGVLVDDAVAARLKGSIKSKRIRFSVEVRTRVGIWVGGKSTGRMPIRVVCGAVSLRQLASSVVSPRCRINLLRWY